MVIVYQGLPVCAHIAQRVIHHHHPIYIDLALHTTTRASPHLASDTHMLLLSISTFLIPNHFISDQPQRQILFFLIVKALQIQGFPAHWAIDVLLAPDIDALVMKDVPAIGLPADLVPFDVDDTHGTVVYFISLNLRFQDLVQGLFGEEEVEVGDIVVDFVLHVVLLVLHPLLYDAAHQHDDDDHEQYPDRDKDGDEDFPCSLDIVHEYLHWECLRPVQLYPHDQRAVRSIRECTELVVNERHHPASIPFGRNRSAQIRGITLSIRVLNLESDIKIDTRR